MRKLLALILFISACAFSQNTGDVYQWQGGGKKPKFLPYSWQYLINEPTNFAWEDSANIFSKDNTIGVGKYLLFGDTGTTGYMGIRNSSALGRLSFVYDVGGGSEATIAEVRGDGLYTNGINPLTLSYITIGGSLLPLSTATYNLGSSTVRWKKGYFSDSIWTDGKVKAQAFYGDGSGLTGVAVGVDSGDWLKRSNNLSDLFSSTTARSNLGLGTTDRVHFQHITTDSIFFDGQSHIDVNGDLLTPWRGLFWGDPTYVWGSITDQTTDSFKVLVSGSPPAWDKIDTNYIDDGSKIGYGGSDAYILAGSGTNNIVNAPYTVAVLDTDAVLMTMDKGSGQNLVDRHPTVIEATTITNPTSISFDQKGHITGAVGGGGGGTSLLSGQASFSGQTQRLAFYNANINVGDLLAAIPAASNDETYPTANDVLMAFAKADSGIITRPASGTTDMGINWWRVSEALGFNPMLLTSISVKYWGAAGKESGKADDEVLTSMADNSSYGNHLTANNVIYKSSGHNGKPYYLFRGRYNDAYAYSDASELSFMNGLDKKYIVLAVLKADSMLMDQSRNYTVNMWTNSATGAGYLHNYLRYYLGTYDTAKINIQFYGFDSAGGTVLPIETKELLLSNADSVYLTTEACIVGWAKELDTMTVYFNNLTPAATGASDVDTNSVNRFVLGGFYSPSTGFSASLGGQLYEIIIAEVIDPSGKISATDLEYIMDYWDSYYDTQYTP